jgi:hypothetical protein
MFEVCHIFKGPLHYLYAVADAHDNNNNSYNELTVILAHGIHALVKFNACSVILCKEK